MEPGDISAKQAWGKLADRESGGLQVFAKKCQSLIQVFAIRLHRVRRSVPLEGQVRKISQGFFHHELQRPGGALEHAIADPWLRAISLSSNQSDPRARERLGRSVRLALLAGFFGQHGCIEPRKA